MEKIASMVVSMIVLASLNVILFCPCQYMLCQLQPGFHWAQAVAPGEVVAAIRDMLSAADLPLGLEQERLLEQSLTLQQQLKATQAALNHQHAVPSVTSCPPFHNTSAASVWPIPHAVVLF